MTFEWEDPQVFPIVRPHLYWPADQWQLWGVDMPEGGPATYAKLTIPTATDIKVVVWDSRPAVVAAVRSLGQITVLQSIREARLITALTRPAHCVIFSHGIANRNRNLEVILSRCHRKRSKQTPSLTLLQTKEDSSRIIQASGLLTAILPLDSEFDEYDERPVTLLAVGSNESPVLIRLTFLCGWKRTVHVHSNRVVTKSLQLLRHGIEP